MSHWRRAGAAALLAVCATRMPAQAAAQVPCPTVMPSGTVCADGQDANGSFSYLARPARWNGTLIVLDHGGPQYTTPPSLQEVVRIAAIPGIAIRVADGYALAIPSYRDQYWHMDRCVAGMLAGSLLDGDYRLDTRVVYQYFCHDFPAPDEPQYPLWRGLRAMPASFAAESLFTVAMPGLLQRMHECTGWDMPDSARTAAQRQRYRQSIAVMHKDTADFRARIGFAAMLYSIQAIMTGGRNVFGNRRAVYEGSDDDAALNRGWSGTMPTRPPRGPSSTSRHRRVRSRFP